MHTFAGVHACTHPHANMLKTPTAGGSHRREGAAKFRYCASAGSVAAEFMNIIRMCLYVAYDINVDSNMEAPLSFHLFGEHY